MATNIGKETILGRLRDEGVKTVLVNRIEELLQAYGNNIPQFCALTKGGLSKTYNTLHPDGDRGVGAKTWKTFERFCQVYRELLADARDTARAVVEEQERKEAEKASMREQLLERELAAENILVALDILEKLGQKTFPLKDLLEFHDRAAKARGDAQ